MKNLLDTYDLAALLRVDRKTLTRWISKGKIKPHKIPGTRRNFFLRQEIEDQLQLPHLGDDP